MLESYTITDIKQLKALSHQCRIRILNALTEKPMTAKQLADALNEEPAKTSYHVKQLLKVGLVELKYTRQTQNGIVEKYYQAIAREFQTDPGLAGHTESSSHQETGLAQQLNKVQADFLRAHREDPQTACHGLRRLDLTPEKLPGFLAELDQLLARFESPEGGYTLQYLIYPAEGKEPKA